VDRRFVSVRTFGRNTFQVQARLQILSHVRWLSGAEGRLCVCRLTPTTGPLGVSPSVD
jgi:hypothetical protein